MTSTELRDLVWKALADATRRELLDALAAGPLTTGQLVEQFDSLCRTNVMKHLEILVSAKLVVIRREGRTRWNYLNPAPIQQICDRWVSKHVKKMASAMSRLKTHVETADVAVGGLEPATATSSTTGKKARRNK